MTHINWEVLQSFCSLVLGAAIGALCGFIFERIKVRDELRNKEWSSCLMAQFSLGQYAQTLIRLKTQELDKWRDKPDKHMRIKHISFDDRLPEIDINALEFILTKEPDLLNCVQNAFSNCKAAIDSVKERNTQYMRMVSYTNIIQSPTGEEIYQIPELEIRFLSDFTDNMYKQIDFAMDLLPEIQKDLHNFIKTTFKGKHALKITNLLEENETVPQKG